MIVVLITGRGLWDKHFTCSLENNYNIVCHCYFIYKQQLKKNIVVSSVMRNPSCVHIFIRKYFTCMNVKILMIGIQKSVDAWKPNRHVTLKGIAHLH